MSDDEFSEQQKVTIRQVPRILPIRHNIQEVLICNLNHLMIFDCSMFDSSWMG